MQVWATGARCCTSKKLKPIRAPRYRVRERYGHSSVLMFPSEGVGSSSYLHSGFLLCNLEAIRISLFVTKLQRVIGGQVLPQRSPRTLINEVSYTVRRFHLQPSTPKAGLSMWCWTFV